MTDRILAALREIAPVTRGQMNLGGRMLRWVESGTGTPAVVLIAGRNDTALSWGPVLAALAGRAHAVAYDRAGLGDSDPDVKSLLPNGPWLTCRGSAHNGTATGDSELNPPALPPAVVPMWPSRPTHDLVTVWSLRVR